MSNLKQTLFLLPSIFIAFGYGHSASGADLLQNPRVVKALGDIVNEAARELVRKVEIQPFEADSAFVTTRHIMHHERLGVIEFLKRDPVSSVSKTRPLMFVLSGLQSGKDAMKVIPKRGDFSVVTFAYPYDQNLPYEDAIAKVATDIFRIQAQIVAVYAWLRLQQDVDPERMVSLNVSFGSFVAPMPLRFLNMVGMGPQATVFAYGAADYFSVLEYHVNKSSYSLREKTLALDASKRMQNLIRPNQHLPFLNGPFLVIYGLKDDIVPVQSVESLVTNLKGPKTVVPLDTDHIQMDKPGVINQTFDVIFNWLQPRL